MPPNSFDALTGGDKAALAAALAEVERAPHRRYLGDNGRQEP
jgi:hypothetical protein